MIQKEDNKEGNNNFLENLHIYITYYFLFCYSHKQTLRYYILKRLFRVNPTHFNEKRRNTILSSSLSSLSLLAIGSHKNMFLESWNCISHIAVSISWFQEKIERAARAIRRIRRGTKTTQSITRCRSISRWLLGRRIALYDGC